MNSFYASIVTKRQFVWENPLSKGYTPNPFPKLFKQRTPQAPDSTCEVRRKKRFGGRFGNSPFLKRGFPTILILFGCGVACLGGENLISGGDFDTKITPRYLSGDSYSVSLIRRGWDFKRIGPLFWGMPVFTPNGGAAKIRLEEGPGAYEGNGCLLVETTDKDCSAYIGSVFAPGLTYALAFAAKGKGEMNFGAYVYRDNKIIEIPTFITVPLTEAWKTYTVTISLTNPEAHTGGLVLNVKPQTSLYLDSLKLERK